MNKFLISIFFVFIILSFLLLPRNPLLNDDAALYALAAKNAVVHNQWLAQFVTPGDLSSFLDKPPLGIWLLAWIPNIIGINQLTVHISNLLYYLLLLALIFWFVKKTNGKRLALYSALIASTSIVLVVYSRTPKLDVLITIFIALAHFSIYNYLKDNQFKHLYWSSIAIALGFLVKTGFALILPGLTVLFLMLFDKNSRNAFLRFILSKHFVFCCLLFSIMVGSVLLLQSLALKAYWLPYLKSIFIQSKYNTSYLGFGFNYPIIGFLLLTVFPWSALTLTSLIQRKSRPLLPSFYQAWFWSNFFFLLFFFRQTDLRTFTVLVPPLAILAAYKLLSIQINKTSRKAVIAWQIFFVITFGLLALGFNQPAAKLPLYLFVISLTSLLIYFYHPHRRLFNLSFGLICLSYLALFYNTLPLAKAFNDDCNWPAKVKTYQEQGYQFIIYRPHDRNLIMSPDLFYVDFMAGPADQYLWQPQNLIKQHKAIILSDTKSLGKIKLNYILLAKDSYSSLILR